MIIPGTITTFGYSSSSYWFYISMHGVNNMGETLYNSYRYDIVSRNNDASSIGLIPYSKSEMVVAS